MKKGRKFKVGGMEFADVSNPPSTTVTLRRRKGWQTRTTHSHRGADPQTYARKEGLVEIIRVNIPDQREALFDVGAIPRCVGLAKEEFRRARKDGRLKKTAEPGKVTTLAFRRPAVLKMGDEAVQEGPSASQEAPRRALTMTPTRRSLTCPDCGAVGLLNEDNGLSYCVSSQCTAARAKEGSPPRLALDVEAALKDIGDRMESARKGLEDLTRLLLKS